MHKYSVIFLVLVLVSGCFDSESASKTSGDSRSVDEIVGSANALMDAGDYSKAIGEYTLLLDRIKSGGAAVPDDEDLANIYAMRGLAHSNLKEYELAIEELNRALELNPGFGELYVSRALVYLELGDEDSMNADLKRAADAGVDLNELLGG